MKKIYIIRHAKSSWSINDVSDFERPLNERGVKDAPDMAKRLFTKKIGIDGFVSSTAKRALATATFFATTYKQNENSIIKRDELYHAEMETFYTVIKSLDNNLNSIALFSHNPGITDFVTSLTTTRIDNMPTCGIFAIESTIANWKDFSSKNNSFLFFDYPKNLKI